MPKKFDEDSLRNEVAQIVVLLSPTHFFACKMISSFLSFSYDIKDSSPRFSSLKPGDSIY